MHTQCGEMDAPRTSGGHGLALAHMSAEAGPRGAGTTPGEKEATELTDEAGEAVGTAGRRRKPLPFYMAFLCLVIMVFLCSMDSTIMAVSIPVSQPQLDHRNPSEWPKVLTNADNYQRIGRHYFRSLLGKPRLHAHSCYQPAPIRQRIGRARPHDTALHVLRPVPGRIHRLRHR